MRTFHFAAHPTTGKQPWSCATMESKNTQIGTFDLVTVSLPQHTNNYIHWGKYKEQDTKKDTTCNDCTVLQWLVLGTTCALNHLYIEKFSDIIHKV